MQRQILSSLQKLATTSALKPSENLVKRFSTDLTQNVVTKIPQCSDTVDSFIENTITTTSKEHVELKDETGKDAGYLLTEGWKETTASESEAIIKAERHADYTVEEMQKKTVEHHSISTPAKC
jgi:hypothetical protein